MTRVSPVIPSTSPEPTRPQRHRSAQRYREWTRPVLGLCCLLGLALSSWSCAEAARGAAGEACLSRSDCSNDMPCVDGVCCPTACDNTCESCALPGSEGTCTAIPAGQDPDDECGTVNCATLYAGWEGESCHWGTTVSADAAMCSGERACRSQTEECAAADQGAEAFSCDTLCQMPVDDSCQGDIPGECTNLDRGAETCGFGACQVTQPRCVEGMAMPCQPDMTASSPEVCNGRDDDCDGLVDDDWAEPNEDCTQFQNLVPIYSNQFRDYNDLTIFQSGDVDYFKITASEADARCDCCDGPACQDEDFELYLYLTAPNDGGIYEFCAASACSDVASNCVNVPASGDRTLIFSRDGSCSSNDSFQFFVRVRGIDANANSCTPYLLSYEFVTGCFGV